MRRSSLNPPEDACLLEEEQRRENQCLARVDREGKVERRFDILQKISYFLAAPSVVKSRFTDGGLRESLGWIWTIDQDGLWNLTSFLHEMSSVPRLFREKNRVGSGKGEGLAFWITLLHNLLVLLPVTLTCITTITIDAIRYGFSDVLLESKETLGDRKTPDGLLGVLVLDTLAYGITMMICAAKQGLRLYRAHQQSTPSKMLCVLQQKQQALLQENPEYILMQRHRDAIESASALGIFLNNVQNRAFWRSLYGIIRDGACMSGAFLGALTMLLTEHDIIFTASMVCYLISTVMNAGELLYDCCVDYRAPAPTPEQQEMLGEEYAGLAGINSLWQQPGETSGAAGYSALDHS